MNSSMPAATKITIARESLVDATDQPTKNTAPSVVIASQGFASAIYAGWVRHRRHAPHANAFSYRMYMMYIDLTELDHVFAGRWLWSTKRRNLAQFRRSDYFGDATQSLDAAVREHVARTTGARPRGPIRLLAHLRYFGVCFNPVSFYYCYAEDGTTLETIVADITNTPWKERHAYVLPVASATRRNSALAWQFGKAFHVSPFLPMQCRYDWRFTVPGENLHVHMDVYKSITEQDDGWTRELDATLVLQRHELNAANLARVLARHPLMTLKVVAAIHWQALRLFLRRNPVFSHAQIKPARIDGASPNCKRPSESRHEP
ncbi:MAG: DUF1365 domain-containing protein [Rudaea sp.]